MSDFRFACKNCRQRITADDAYRGREITCPACGKPFMVPAPVAKNPLPSAAQITAARAEEAAAKIHPYAMISWACAFGLALGSIPGIIFGHLALRQYKKQPGIGGKGVAVTGLALSYFFLLGAIAVLSFGFITQNARRGRQLTSAEQVASLAMSNNIVDEVTPGDPVSESTHQVQSRNTTSGKYNGRYLRDARGGGFFSYSMKVDATRDMSLYCTYWGNDTTPRRFDILVDETVIGTQSLDFNDPGHFFDVEYKIPRKLTRGKSTVTVVFQAYPGKIAGGLFGLRTMKRS